jgi:hypothetical protein
MPQKDIDRPAIKCDSSSTASGLWFAQLWLPLRLNNGLENLQLAVLEIEITPAEAK